MTKPLKTVLILCAVFGLCQIATANTYNVTLDTAPLVGHPAGPFVVFLEFTDGSGIGDANNTVTLSGLDFSGGSALGSPIVFGGASGSLENGISITDTSVISFFEEGFNPGLQLSFSLDLTLNDDSGGTPDRFTFFLLDSSQVPLPTLAPFGDLGLADAVDAPEALLDAVRVPGQVVVDHEMSALEVDPFAGGVGREQNRDIGVGLEELLRLQAFLAAH